MHQQFFFSSLKTLNISKNKIEAFIIKVTLKCNRMCLENHDIDLFTIRAEYSTKFSKIILYSVQVNQLKPFSFKIDFDLYV